MATKILDGKAEQVTPADIAGMKAYLDANRSANTPFDIVMNGSTRHLDETPRQDALLEWGEAGLTWWIEGLWEQPEESLVAYVRRGPPALD